MFDRQKFNVSISNHFIVLVPQEKYLVKVAGGAVVRKMNKLGRGIIHGQKSGNSGAYTIVPYQIPSGSGAFPNDW
jgi:hypothetical protein